MSRVAFLKASIFGGIVRPSPGETELAFELEAKTVHIVNPGSVGQPRDGDPRAAYALYDADNRLVRLRRVEYRSGQNTEKDQNCVGLPDALGLRLFDCQ